MTATAALPVWEATPTGASAKVRLRGVSKSFPLNGRQVPVLAPFDFDIREGEFLCVVGPSGCGKTTLLRILPIWKRKRPGTWR